MPSLDARTFEVHARMIQSLRKDFDLQRRKLELLEDEVRVLRDELGAFK